MLSADLTLARRLEAAEAFAGVECAETCRRLKPSSGAAIEPVAGGYAVFLGVDSPLTRATGLGMNDPVSAAQVEVMEAFFRSRGSPAFVDLCPLADPSLVGLFRGRPYRLSEFKNVLIRPLAANASFPPAAEGVDARVAGPSRAKLWARTVAQGFAGAREAASADLEVSTILYGLPGSTCFLASVGGKVAGGGALSLHQGMAMLFADSTLPACRKRGAHTALIRARLAFAAKAGCYLAVAATAPGSPSQRNYERAGFRPVYTKATLVREWQT